MWVGESNSDIGDWVGKGSLERKLWVADFDSLEGGINVWIASEGRELLRGGRVIGKVFDLDGANETGR